MRIWACFVALAIALTLLVPTIANAGVGNCKPAWKCAPTTTRATTTTRVITTTTTVAAVCLLASCIPPADAQTKWSAGFETGNLSEYGPQSQDGGSYDSGNCARSVSQDTAHSGSWSMKFTIDTRGGTSGCRQFRWKESRTIRDAWYEAWVKAPDVTFGGNLTWNAMQFKSRSSDGVRSGNVDPIWSFDITRDTQGMYVHAGYGWGGTALPGAGRWYEPSPKKYLTPGVWAHFVVHMVESSGAHPDGHVQFWLDPQGDDPPQIDVPNAYTSYNNTNYNGWGADDEFAVNFYSDNVSPSPATAYWDDLRISAVP